MPITDLSDNDVGLLDTPGKTMLIEFYNDRCPACLAVQKTVEQFAGESGGDTMVCRVNTDNSPGLAPLRHHERSDLPRPAGRKCGRPQGRRARRW